MNKKTRRMMTNWIMLVSLIVVMTTGMLLRPYPGMWMGITHALSGFVLTISIVIHCFQHKFPGKAVKKCHD